MRASVIALVASLLSAPLGAQWLNQPTGGNPRLLGTYEFIKDDRGVVTHLLAHGVEGTSKAIRRRATGAGR